MKISVVIPDKEIQDLLRFTRAKTKGQAIVKAINEFNRRHRMADIVKHFGSCQNLLTNEELMKLRQAD